MVNCDATNDRITAIEYSGVIAIIPATIRVDTRYSTGGMPMVSSASISSLMRIAPNCAVTPAPKDGGNFDGVEVCATGTEGTIYGCESVDTTGDYVSTVNGFHGVPAGTPVWVRSSVSDGDSTSAQLLGLVAVPGEGQGNPALVSLVPVVGDNGDIVANAADADAVEGAGEGTPDDGAADESTAADAPIADEGTPDEYDEGAGEDAGEDAGS